MRSSSTLGSEMTNSDDGDRISAPEARPGKRERLLSAASALLYQQGVENTTLADIAHAADVPLGNVYYYFKTKDEIVTAVIEGHVHDIEVTIASTRPWEMIECVSLPSPVSESSSITSVSRQRAPLRR